MVSIIGIPGIPLVEPGDDVAALLLDAMDRAGVALADGDVLVVASKILSKADGRIVALDTVEPSDEARRIAEETERDPRLVELVLREAASIVHASPRVILTRHRLGFTSANAGIDQSNVAGDDVALLLPEDPDRSAAELRARVVAQRAIDIGVVVADTHGRLFRWGNVGTAIGVAGLPALIDRRGDTDLFGRVLQATMIPVADAIAAAATLVTGETDEGIPAVVVRGLDVVGPSTATARDLVRAPTDDIMAEVGWKGTSEH